MNLNSRTHIDLIQFENINWLPVNVQFEQFIGSMTIKFLSKMSFPCMNDAFKPAGQHNAITKTCLLKLNQPFRKTNH